MSAVGGGAGAGGGSGSGAAHASRAPPAAPGGNGGAAPPYDVFISYAHEDGMDVAARLEAGLTRRGLRVWRDKHGLYLGDIQFDEIGRGLDSSSHAIVVASPAYADSRWTMIELGGMMRGNFKGRIIPVLYKTDRDYVASKLPMLADRLAGTWTDDAEPLMDEIERSVKSAHEDSEKPTVQTDDGATDMDMLTQASKGAAASIPREISGTTIGRGEQVAAVKGLLESRGRVAIVGGKGSGKSVISCLLYERLAPSGAALLVRCDDFLGAESAEELDRAIVPGRSLVDLARSVAKSQPGAVAGMTIVFDSLDAAGRNERTMRAFRRLLEMVWGAGARTVVTVRSYDYEYSDVIGTTDWGEKYELGALSDGEVGAILQKLGSPAVPPRLKKLLSNPLNLHLFSLVLKKSPGADLASIGSEIDLYDAHWRHYVEMEPLDERVRDTLYNIAEEMTRARKTLVPYDPGDQEASALAQSSGILVRTRDGGSVRYFHHAYLDYAMSRALLERHQPVEEYLRADEYNVFLRPTLSFTLAMAHRRDPGEFASAVEGILLAGIKYHWKIAALESLASVVPEGGGTYARLEGLLTDGPILQRHFLIGLAKRRNASWLLAWGGTLAAWASDPRNPNGAFIVGYLEAVAAADRRCHGPLFAVATALAENSMDQRVRRRAVAALANIDASGKSEWLRKMSRSADPRVRAGVAHNLPRLLERDPDAVPDIFCNLYAYGEEPAEKAGGPASGIPGPASSQARDNHVNKMELGRMFPQLMGANPPVMARAAILAAEHANRGILSRPGPGLVDDRLQWWRRMAFCGDGDPALDHTRKYVGECGNEEFSRLVSVLEGTRLASFRGMLISAMAKRGPAFLDKLVDLLSDPWVHGVYTLRQTVRGAIGAVHGLLDEEQKGRILGAAAGPGALRGGPGGAEMEGDATPPAVPPWSPCAATPSGRAPPASWPSVIGTGGTAPAPRPEFRLPLENAIEDDPVALADAMLDAHLTCELDRDGKIFLLECFLEALDGRPADLDKGLVDRVTAFLIEARLDTDPVDNAAAASTGPDGTPAAARSVRGLAAECLIRIAARHGGGAVLDAIRELSVDPAATVRIDVARSLERLLLAHYDTARGIAMYYSRDPDARVRSPLPAVLHHIAQREPAAASAMVGNMLESSPRPPNGLAPLLLWLAMVVKEPRSAELLRRIADEGAFSKELRTEIPFLLAEGYLASRGHRGAALGLLRALLDDPEPEVRRRAALFTLHGFDDDPAIDDREYIGEIAPHLDRMASMLGDKPPDLDIAEMLTAFLEKFWRYIPEAALALLEKTAKINDSLATFEPTIADGSLNVLAGLLRHHSLYDGEWNRCLDVLDEYAAAGWPAALDLLAKMGERS